MKNRFYTRGLVPLFLALFALASLGFGQTAPTQTTLTAAVPNTGNTSQGRFVNVASATNILAPGLNQPQGGVGSPVGGPNETGLLIDGELMRVNSVNGLIIGVERGVQGTRAIPHVNGSTVIVGPFSMFSNYDRTGACSISGTSVIAPAIQPVINITNGRQFICPTVGPNAGNWLQIGQFGYPGAFNTSDNTVAGSSDLLVCHARYNFAVDGGAVSTITPAVGCTIPINAVIYRVLVNNVVAPIGSTGNVSVGLSAGGAGTAALLAATARGSLTVGTIFEGIPVAASASSSNTSLIKMTAAGNVTVTIATNALTAGVMDIFVFYYTEQA